ncbi:hypothetical protein [Cerasicoccus fimbriatus]|uniref:hypothetical protein n=1 Tax=Cerasicoccus fimbriatus TaxID=3014554 RepID=UPI0022B58702|nr:hypothetical protein [Cerasicoccus sp. TK19100]
MYKFYVSHFAVCYVKTLCSLFAFLALSISLHGAEDEEMVVYRLAGQCGAPNFDSEIDSLSIESLPYILEQIRQEDYYRSRQAIYILSRKLKQFRGELSEGEVDAMVAVITSRIETDPSLMKSSFVTHTVARIENPQVAQLAQQLESSDDEDISAAANRILVTQGLKDAPTQRTEKESDSKRGAAKDKQSLILAAVTILLLSIGLIYCRTRNKRSKLTPSS